jgi:hypothetical protein
MVILEPKLSYDTRQTNWVNLSIKAVILFVILIVSNFLIITVFGSRIWSNASYFFGNNIQTTLGILLFIEGGIFLALGSLWALGSSENTSYGIYRKNYGSFSEEDWKSRIKLAKNPGDVIRALLIVGSLTLISAFVTILV